MATTPFTFSGALNLPGGPGLPNDAIPMVLASNFTAQAEFKLELLSSGTQVVDLGTITTPGVKGLLILVAANTTAAPVEVRINGSSTGGIEISPGGLMAVGSPSPVTGITSISIVYTTTNSVRLWALG